ncbi:MAG: helix-turn-helix domain-containing protein [Blastocatellia bacterium]|nr:helix-turn-helix domain-containing protein [Blastocatellia bacterium]
MDKKRKKQLEAAGWRVGSAEEFLEMTKEETAIVEMKIALAGKVKALRQKHHLSQIALAERIGSSQSRVAKIEAGDPSVSFDLLIRAALAAGGSKEELAKAIVTTV